MQISHTSKHRVNYLDSTRGLAALIVLLAHFQLTVLPSFTGSLLYKTPLRILFDADAAVLYFFILSGFVLTKSINNISKLSFQAYSAFVIKRIYRIYPAFLVAFIFTYFGILVFSKPANGWLSQFWQDTSLDIPGFLKQILLVKRLPNDPLLRILPHDWTLSIEMAVSLLLPLLAFASRINSWLTLLLIYLSVKFPGLDPFAFDFSLGIFLSMNYQRWPTLGKAPKLLFGLLSIMLICGDYLFPEIAIHVDRVLIHHKSWGLVLILIIILSSARIQKILSLKPLNFLGKISYSFYLFHFGILLIMNSLFASINSITFLLFYCIATVIISTFIYYLIEKPYINSGRKLAGKLTKTTS